ncbi:uncharacterized protein F4807DRAFT_303993 [Annulohypoxylon truncatum]|uniref:uncharacterized protein n=1 Tax=Annulohypoxylon truncatum TaxID=327061 RepID=UPI00200796AA|nr:uncharacterized protein F4807DRAFT_303993 [Annulohypoxylon truncatum]KAI1212900.1 hypothetical protein F4807DRAFT_303993 [Annulohypoxylon truncatum]
MDSPSTSTSPSTPSSLLDVPSPAERLCDPCYLILHAERPPAPTDPADRTRCANCFELVGRMAMARARRDSVGGSWVDVDVGAGDGAFDDDDDGWADGADEVDEVSVSGSGSGSEAWEEESSCYFSCAGSDVDGGEEEGKGKGVDGKENKESEKSDGCEKSKESDGNKGNDNKKGSKCSNLKKLKPLPSPAVYAAKMMAPDAFVRDEGLDKANGSGKGKGKKSEGADAVTPWL